MKFDFNMKKIFFIFLFFISNNFISLYCDSFFDEEEINWDLVEEPQKQFTDDADLKNLFLLSVASEIYTPLWNHTKQPKGRDVLYLLPHRITAIEYGGVIFNLFFNYTNKMNFSTEEALRLNENQEALNTFLKGLKDSLTDQEISSIIPLFNKLVIQERKIGLLLQAGIVTGPFSLQLNTSLLFDERNFWLSKSAQQEITNMFSGDGMSFDKKELYKYEFGLGDSRIKAGLNALNLSSFQLDVGLETIIPTSILSNIPRLQSYDINFDDFDTTLANVLYSIRDNLLNPQLGNNGHLGLGFYAESKLDLFHDFLHIWNRISFDNLFQAKEDRLIMSKQTINTPLTAKQILDFEEQPEKMTAFIKEFVFPPAYRVGIKPGGIFNFVLNATVNLGKKWQFGLGYDYYMQQKEEFTQIYNSGVDPSTLRIDDAESPRAAQHKIFAEATYIKKQKKYDLNLGVGGDYTISSVNMGHDWTVFLRFGLSF